MPKLIKFIFILSLIDPITNSPFGNLKKGFLIPKEPSKKLIQNLTNLNEQRIGETSKNIEKIKNLSKNESSLEEVKIRVLYQDNVPGHAFIVVGDYEYDFMTAGARRRIFLYDIANKLEENDKKRPQVFKGLGLFVCPRKVEQSFFEMASRFWFGQSFSPSKANCLDFVFNFVCALFDGDCPKKEIWPDNFVNFDKDMFRDYLKLGNRREPALALERKPISLPAADDDHNCVLKDHHLEFRISNYKCDVNDEGGICANFVLSHFTGLFDQPVLLGEELKNKILVETKPKKVWKHGENIHLVAVLKAYSCKILANLSMSSVGYLILLNKTTKKFIKTKNVCHSHFFGLLNLDEIIGHIVEVEFGGWTQINSGKNN
ncbi:hypothetical protein GPALN_003081 [Globodera pallida]|nr:hypothetical protein GPALN_003081 [Globodera pallida]